MVTPSTKAWEDLDASRVAIRARTQDKWALAGLRCRVTVATPWGSLWKGHGVPETVASIATIPI